MQGIPGYYVLPYPAVIFPGLPLFLCGLKIQSGFAGDFLTQIYTLCMSPNYILTIRRGVYMGSACLGSPA